MQYPATSIACDCGATTETRTHPRMYGTFPRVLGHYVRETHVLTWEDAIRKMTALPAATIGMVDRGQIQPGMAADITVFDPVTVTDRATYEAPAQLSEGIRFVVVNGKIALRDGKVTGEQGGRILARSPHMPSRPMSAATLQQVSLHTTVNGTAFTIRLSQNAGARHAAGTFEMRDTRSGTALDATDLGAIQSTTDWSSFTGRLRRRDTGEEHAFVAIVERADPFADGHPLSVIVYLDGKPR